MIRVGVNNRACTSGDSEDGRFIYFSSWATAQGVKRIPEPTIADQTLYRMRPVLVGAMIVRRLWLIVAGVSSTLSAQPLSIVRVADSSMLIPGMTVPFQFFGAPGAENGIVGFVGYRNASPTSLGGVYRGPGGPLQIVADTNIPVPSGTGNFIGFANIAQYWPDLEGANTAFIGDGPGKTVIQRGIYLRTPSGLQRIVDRTFIVPNGTGGTFFIILPPTLRGDRIAFVGAEAGNGQRGVYRWQNGDLSVVADKSTPIPGAAGTFTSFADCDFDRDGTLVFSAQGAGGYWGIFRVAPGGEISRVYDTTTLVPGGSGTFTLTGEAVTDLGRIAFYGTDDVQNGIYTDLTGTLDYIAHIGTPVPDRPGLFFDGFGYCSLSGNTIAFTGNIGGGQGVFYYRDGQLHRIICFGDVLDGRTVANANSGPASLSGNTVGVHVRFFDESHAIYMATLPPSCYADCNADAALNLSDFGCFTTRFALAQPYADCNGDGLRTLADFGCFMTKFALGCP